MLLNLETSYDITDEEKQILDEKIDQTLSLHKENSALMNRLVMDSVTALTTSKARSEVLANQGFFQRFLGGITGKTIKSVPELIMIYQRHNMLLNSLFKSFQN